MPQLYVETVKESFCGQPLISTVRPATEEEVAEAKRRFEEGELCDHRFVVDDVDWMYSYRYCGICGAGLGAI